MVFLDENGQMTKGVFNSFGPSSSHTVSKCNSDIEKVPQSSVKSNLTSKMDKPKQPAENISKGTTIMSIPVVEFSRKEYKIRKVFG